LGDERNQRETDPECEDATAISHTQIFARLAGRIDRLIRVMHGRMGTSLSADREEEASILRIYGRIFLVTYSKPVQRKSTEDNPLTGSVCAAV
jgi:hypothetical protein